jgi:hypothetical protein
MSRQTSYSWDGLTLTYRAVLTGADLSPEWALVRVRRALEENRGDAAGRASDGHLTFDDAVTSVSLTGAILPTMVSGQVRAQSVPGGIAVIASASLVPLLVGGVLSLAIGGAFFYWRGLYVFPGYWIWLLFLSTAAAWHLRQITRVLRMVTTAGTSL